MHARHWFSKLTARRDLPFAPWELMLLGAVLSVGLSWWSAGTFDLASLWASVLFGAGLGLLAAGVALLVVSPRRPAPLPVALPAVGQELRIVFDDAHLVSLLEEPGLSRIVLSSRSSTLEYVDPDGRLSPAPSGVTVPEQVEIRLPSGLPHLARAACDSGLPGTVTVFGSLSAGPVPGFHAGQLLVDFPLWSEAYL